MRRRRQRYTAPDGIDWRDPNMPVLRPWEFPDGSVGLKAIDPDEEKQYRATYGMNNPLHIHYRDDPTYRAKRKRRRIK